MRNPPGPRRSAAVVPVQQPPAPLCVDCGTPVEPGGRVSSQAQRCPTCQRPHRRRALLRAYIVSAAKLAAALGNDDLAIALHRLSEGAR